MTTAGTLAAGDGALGEHGACEEERVETSWGVRYAKVKSENPPTRSSRAMPAALTTMLTTLLAGAAAFSLPSPTLSPHAAASSQQLAVSMMAKGFGAPQPKPKPQPKKKKGGKVFSGVQVPDQAAKDLEKLKASGNPEYMVMIRECPNGEEVCAECSTGIKCRTCISHRLSCLCARAARQVVPGGRHGGPAQQLHRRLALDGHLQQ